MCPTPPLATYRKLADDTTLPESLRTAAQSHIDRVTLARASLAKAEVTGPLPQSKTKTKGAFNCAIYTLDYQSLDDVQLPGRLLQDTNGVDVKEKSIDGSERTDVGRLLAWTHAEQTFNFYKTVFKRDSLDGMGIEIRASIHRERALNDAVWKDNQKQIVLGDAGQFDGRGWLQPTKEQLEAEAKLNKQISDQWDLMNKQTTSETRQAAIDEWNRLKGLLRHYDDLATWMINYDIDTIGHELTHGVIMFTANLGDKLSGAEYNEAGTLNEHIADCFGMMIKHWVNKDTAANGNWDFSPHAWAPNVLELKGWKSKASDNQQWEENYCRTFRIPEHKSPDEFPKHWKDHKEFRTADVHENCGIGNHAFYQAARAFNGNIWEKPGQIWYDALTDPEFQDPKKQNFLGWRDLTIKHAKTPEEKGVIKAAWSKVGL